MREGCQEVGGGTGLFRSRGLVSHARRLDFIRSTRGEETCDPGSRRGLCVCVCAGPTAPPWGFQYRYKGVWGQMRGSWDLPHWSPRSSRQPREL